MLTCFHGQIDIARMLAGEFNANIDIQSTVKAISRSCLWRVGVVVIVVVVIDIITLLVSIYATMLSIAPLHLVVMDAMCYVDVFFVVVVVVV